MEGLTEIVPRLHAALFAARADEARQIEQALTSHQVIGVHGDPEIGVTALLSDVIAAMGKPVIRLDLAGAYSDDHLAWTLAHQLARVLVDPVELSLAGLGEGLRPMHATHAVRELHTQLGDVAELALSAAPDPTLGVGLADAFAALQRVAQGRVDLAVWVDHLQEPGLTSRHPVDVDALLWRIRAVQQQVDLQVILSANRSASRLAYEPQRAFYGDGEWITLRRPTDQVWQTVARTVHPDVTPGWMSSLVAMTERHPATTLSALATHQLRPVSDPRELWGQLVSLQAGLTPRSLQHARSLHRLGGELLERIADGEGPYQPRFGLPSKDITKIIDRLHHAGLIWQPAPRTWRITNPIVGAQLRGGSFMPTGDSLLTTR